MRWSNLSAGVEETARLPGYRDEAVVRHFDAPEGVSTRFYEIHAKSIINRVPEVSQVPFRWTVNPYRGCTHACTYCLWGQTPVVMADGRHRAIEQIEVGDRIVGTRYDGKYRRYVDAVVLDRWINVEEAYRVTLADGTELIASGDHRFLSNRGWTHVADADDAQRPHLTTSDQLAGPGRSATEPSCCRQGTVATVSRMRQIQGQMVRTAEDLRVTAVEPLGCRLPLYDITTTTGDFIADGVVSHNCFARPTHKYLDFDAGRDFEREIVVKVNAPERLRVELARPSWRGEHVALGTNTDPYQWVEKRYGLTRGIWEAMRDARNPCSILTKSPLLLRDLELFKQIDEVTEFSAALSIPTIDERAWRSSEPHTPNPKARLEAVRTLSEAGIRTGVLVAPLMPGINDDPAQVREILEQATEAGAQYVTGIALHLRGEVRRVFMSWLAETRPDLVDRYAELYARGAYAPAAERRRLQRLLHGAPPSQWRMQARAPQGTGNSTDIAGTPRFAPSQQALF